MTKGLLKSYIRACRHKRLLQIIHIPTNATVLDVSCSDGKFIKRLHDISPEATYFGVDISHEDIEQAKAHFPFATFSIGSAGILCFKDASFDAVFSVLSLHHYENPADFFRETFRILKTDGILYLCDLFPKYSWTQKVYNWNGCPEPYHFEKFYSVKDLEQAIEPAGLCIIGDQKVTSIPRIRVLSIQKA